MRECCGGGAGNPEYLSELAGFAALYDPPPCRATESLGVKLSRPPSDSSFRYFSYQVDVPALCVTICDWTIDQIPGGVANLDQLICDGKALRGSRDLSPRSRSMRGSSAWRSRRPRLTPENPTSVRP